MTRYVKRATVVCPEPHMDDCNSLAAIVASDAAKGPDNLLTFRSASWRDASGNLYAVASAAVLDRFEEAAGRPLTRPAWDTENDVNMTGAGRAQAKVSFTGPASPDKILVIMGEDYEAQLAAAGLTRVEVDI
jgi:hypothetical protein